MIVPYIIFFDDFQINNPLGTHIHSICGCYINFPTMPQHLLSKLDYIFFAAFISSTNLKENGNERSFYQLVEQLKPLENGVEILTGNETRKFHFVLGSVIGDNLAVNSVLGFVQSFNAKKYCRVCLRTKVEMQCDETEHFEFFRNDINYQKDLALQDHKESGIRTRCIFEDLPSFSVVDNFCFDIMHDVYEGVCVYDVCNVLI